MKTVEKTATPWDTALFAVLALLPAYVVAQDANGRPPDSQPVVTVEERRLIHDAGMVNGRQGERFLCVADFRAAERVGGLASAVEKIEDFTHLIIPVEKHKLNEGEDAVKAAFSLLGKERGSVIAVVDDAASPSMNVFPEDGVAVVNVGRLAIDLPKKDAGKVLEARLARELWRAVAFVLGGYETEYRCVVKNIRSPKELDALPKNTCPPVSEKIFEGAAKLNFARVERVTYAIAILEGWASPPTTDAQKKLVEYYKANGRLPATNDTSKASASAAK